MRISDWSSDVCSSDLARWRSMACVIRCFARLVRQSRRRLAPILRVCIPVPGVRVLPGAPLPGYDTHTRTLRLGGLDYRIRSLADLQQFADPDNHAQLLGISSRSDEHTSELQ